MKPVSSMTQEEVSSANQAAFDEAAPVHGKYYFEELLAGFRRKGIGNGTPDIFLSERIDTAHFFYQQELFPVPSTKPLARVCDPSWSPATPRGMRCSWHRCPHWRGVSVP